MLVPALLWLHHALDWSLAYLSFLSEAPSPPAWDYVVVGAGSAGCLLAGRLAGAGHRVLLLEAGGASPALAYVPGTGIKGLHVIRYLPSLQLQFTCTVCTAICTCKQGVSGLKQFFTSTASCTHCTSELDL